MFIHLHIILAGVPKKKGRLTIEAPPGATVGQVLEQYAGLAGDMKGIAMLVNGAPAKRDKVLFDGDTLKVYRPVAGG